MKFGVERKLGNGLNETAISRHHYFMIAHWFILYIHATYLPSYPLARSFSPTNNNPDKEDKYTIFFHHISTPAQFYDRKQASKRACMHACMHTSFLTWSADPKIHNEDFAG